jgi:hypothetical protein
MNFIYLSGNTHMCRSLFALTFSSPESQLILSLYFLIKCHLPREMHLTLRRVAVLRIFFTVLCKIYVEQTLCRDQQRLNNLISDFSNADMHSCRSRPCPQLHEADSL